MSNKPIIICGTGRSGTSVFTRLLGLHPNIFAFRWESQIFSGLPGLVDIVNRSFNKEVIGAFRNHLLNHLYERKIRPGTDTEYAAGLFEIITREALEEAFENMLVSLERATHRQGRLRALSNFADTVFKGSLEQAKATRWAEKTPRNLIYADSINEILGGCKFVNVVRDGRDVVSSIVDRKFWPIAKSRHLSSLKDIGGAFTVENGIHYWRALIEVGRNMEAKLGSDIWLTIKLEDLARNPEETWRVVFHFLEEEFNESVLDANSEILKRKPAGQTEWSKGAHIERWRVDLTEEQQTVCIKNASDELAYFGYI